MRRTLLSCALLLAAGHAVASTAWVSNEKDNTLSLIDKIGRASCRERVS